MFPITPIGTWYLFENVTVDMGSGVSLSPKPLENAW
jgi:hypothetical protein